MDGEYKEFDQELFDENDVKARESAKQIIESSPNRGKVYDDVIDNKDKYGPDLVLLKKYQKVGYVEVEVKKVWEGQHFPWTSVQIPERKKKFIYKDMVTYFIVFNRDLTKALGVTSKGLLDSPIKDVKTKYTDNEKFFQVPLGYVKFFNTDTTPIKEHIVGDPRTGTQNVENAKPFDWKPEDLEAEKKFGSYHARLFNHVNKIVKTPEGTGKLWQIFANEAKIHMGGIRSFHPTEVYPMEEE